jgi:hypothetical protein
MLEIVPLGSRGEGSGEKAFSYLVRRITSPFEKSVKQMRDIKIK